VKREGEVNKKQTIVIANSNYDSIDIMKFLLAILVVALHAQVPILMNVGRLAVPFFFIASSFFFFAKYDHLITRKERSAYLKKYCMRVFRLYISWWILYLPFFIKTIFDEYANDGIIGCIATIVRIPITGVTPGWNPGWYLIASLYGMIFLILFLRIFPIAFGFCLGIIVEVLSIIGTSYSFLISGELSDLFYKGITIAFPRSILYFSIGCLLARNPSFWAKLSLRKAILFFSVFCAMAAMELIILAYSDLAINRIISDSFFLLTPSVIVLFIIAMKWTISLKHSLYFRKASVIIYCCHAYILNSYDYFVNEDTSPPIVPFIIATGVSMLIAMCVTNYMKRFKILRYLSG